MLLGLTVGSAPDHPNKASRDLFTGGEGLAFQGGLQQTAKAYLGPD